MKLVGFLFSAALFETGVAIGVAPYGMGQGSAAEGLQWNSTESLRTRRARAATNVAVSKASVRASAGLATEVLDDLTRKSRVTLAHSAWKAGEHKLITWNAGGGPPQPEFLGGPWELEYDKMYSEIEKMTGVLLFELGGCRDQVFAAGVDGKKVYFPLEVKDKEDKTKTIDGPYAKYNARYSAMYGDFVKAVNPNLKAEITNKLFLGLEQLKKEYIKRKADPKIAGSNATLAISPSETKDTEKNDPPPDWWKTCNLQQAIGSNLKLCGKPTDKCAFDLATEGCWKKRGALPVYGENFFKLYNLRAGADAKSQTDYWNLYMEGLEKQDTKEIKGCKKAGKAEKPGDNIYKDDSENFPVSIFAEWSKTAAWDTLIIDLTRISIKILTELKTKGVQVEPKHVTFQEPTEAGDAITKIFKGALSELKPDVVFLQEGVDVGQQGVVEDSEYMYQNTKTDTAIYVQNAFGGGLDKAGSEKLQKIWDGMMAALAGKKYQPDISAAMIKLRAQPEFRAKKDKDQVKEAWGEVPFYGIPETQMKKAGFSDKQKTTLFQNTHEKFLPYADEKSKDLVTVAVTKGEPKVLLLSIHADSDGFYCAQYLNIATQFFDAVRASEGLTRMYIGMDANVQPPEGHLSFDPLKGFSFDQLTKVLPSRMEMLEPSEKTVKKVRSFLQTQFGKIGKDDDQKKDLLFTYPDVKFKDKDKKGTVYNVYKMFREEKTAGGDTRYVYEPKFSKLEESTEQNPVNQYYPKNEWPVDHFISMGTVDEVPLVKRLAMRLATAREDCAVKRFFDKAVTKTKETVKAAYDKLCNLVKPKTDAKPDKPKTDAKTDSPPAIDSNINAALPENVPNNNDATTLETPNKSEMLSEKPNETPKEDLKPKVEPTLAETLAEKIWAELGNGEVKK